MFLNSRAYKRAVSVQVTRCRNGSRCEFVRDSAYIDCQERPLIFRFRSSKIDHDIATTFPTEQMWLSLLTEEILLQFGFGVAQEFNVFSFRVEEQVT